MALFESYERRIDKINEVLAGYGISSIEEAQQITKDAGLDVYNQIKGIQPICFENACWAYIVGAAIAIKKGCKTAAEAAAAIGEGLQAFCIPGSVADHRKVGLGHGNLGKMLLEEDTECFAFLAGHESFAAAEGAIGIAEKANKVRKKPLRVILNGLGKDAAKIISRINGFTYVQTEYDYYTGELKEVQTLEPGETLQIAADSTLFETANRIYARPQALSAKTTVDSILRNGKTPVYPGNFEIEKTGEGFLLINELALEDYLRFVVPSEMPASYPAEALKAQAVCARTYAYMHMLHAGLQNYGAHVDDSAAFQVYNNIAEASETSEAVYETKGQMLLSGGTPVTAYFYSTSCGYGTDLTAWNLTYGDEMAATGGYLRARNIAKGQMLSDTQNPDAHSSDAKESAEGSKLAEEDSFATFIKTADADSFEQEDTYYRWRYDTALDTELLLANLQVRYEKSPGNIRRKKGNGYVDEKPEKLGMVTGLTAVKRTTGGVMTELLIEGTEDTYRVCGEQNIRYVLAGENTEIALSADYSKKGTINGMLPSSFFVIEPVYETDDGISTEKAKEAPVVISYTLYGGGFGHGIGMSQNAARRMAQAGYDYKQILQFFYECSIEGVNE